MPTHCVDPPALLLRDFRVGRPVAHAQQSAMTLGLAHAMGRNVHCVASSCGLPASSGETIRFGYLPSPGAVALRVVVELNPTTSGGQKCTVNVTLSRPGGETATDLAGTTGALLLDGGDALECPTAAERVPATYERTFDLNSIERWDDHVIYDVTVTTTTHTGTPKGVRLVSIHEHVRSGFTPEISP
jgi:hypothetical protein